jgi:long-chain acyl-CoA synthetase
MTNYRNLAEVHRRQAEALGPRIAVRYKRDGRYHDLKWMDYRNDALACAAALIELGIQPGDRVGLLGENRIEWMLADLGILTAGAVTVTPHSSLSARQVQFQMQNAGARVLFISTLAQLEKARQICPELPEMKRVVVFDPAYVGDDAIAWDKFLRSGRTLVAQYESDLIRRETTLKPDDLATIMYTSGTTGDPKGVMLTHGNILSNVIACLEVCPLQSDDVPLVWLPLSHIYARTVDFYESLIAGVTMCLAESAETVVANLAEVQPTHMSAVPRFYEKLLTAVASPDPAVTSAKLRHIFGPRMKLLGAGGAPLPAAIEDVLRAAGLPILPGYGLTESSPVITFNTKEQSRPHTVGRAVPGVEVKIAPDGEVLARGPNIMKGYWKNPQATAEAIRDGWLYTGDLGSLDADGFLTITGRKKELLVLSNGKKVIPTQIEGLLVADDCIDQAVVYGEGRSCLTALLVPDWGNLRKALGTGSDKSVGAGSVSDGTEEDLARNHAVHELLRKRVNQRLADVASYEQVKNFIVLPRPFTVAADELTVSLKIRRNVIFAKHQAELDALYRDHP